MRPIPKRLLAELLEDPYYKQCCISGGKDVEFHHNLIFAGRQVNRRFCILPLSKGIHEQIVKYKEVCDWIMWNRSTYAERDEFGKAINAHTRLNQLNKKYGEYREGDPKSYLGLLNVQKNIPLPK